MENACVQNKIHHHVGHNVGHHVGHDVGHHNAVLTLCKVSETLTEWKYESMTDGLTY